MSEAKRIEDQLWRAFYGDAWHGPAVLELLDGIHAGAAAAKPIRGSHSIWEIVLHLAEYGRYALCTSSFIVNEVRRVLTSKFSWSNDNLAVVENVLQLGTIITPRKRLSIVQDAR